jgi:rhodanese-related sulfurtransferase
VSPRDPQPQADAQSILHGAAERGARMGLRYAGAVTPEEAHRLAQAGAAKIVDVRTRAEYEQVGHVPATPLIEWPRSGEPAAVAAFIAAVKASFTPADKLLFLCRSGVRSHYAAEVAAHAGFAGAYNILEGFEGDYGAGTNGWKAAQLPWERG